MSKSTLQLDPKLPLDYSDMLIQQLNYEDQILPYHKRITIIKGEKTRSKYLESTPKIDMRKWSATALFVFGRNVIKRELRRVIV